MNRNAQLRPDLGLSQLLSRVTVIYLLLPSAIFAFGWLRSPYSLISIALLVYCLAILLLEIRAQLSNQNPAALLSSWRSQKVATQIWPPVVLILIAVWLLLSGAGGFGFQNADYRASNALLKDLIMQNWPLTAKLSGVEKPVVYYFGYYLPAALVGKVFGWGTANIFLLLWTYLGAALSFMWFWRFTRIKDLRALHKLLPLVILFVFAGGLDFVGDTLLRNELFKKISSHNEWWAGYFQYSSNTTLLFWVPQQALASWLVTGLSINSEFSRRDLEFAALGISGLVIWSPFGLLGVAPYFLLLVIRVIFRYPQYLTDRRAILISVSAVWVGIANLLFVTANQFSFPVGFIWQTADHLRNLAKYSAAFVFLEFGFLAILILLLFLLVGVFAKAPSSKSFRDLRKMWFSNLHDHFNIVPSQFYLFLVSLVVLTVLPAYRMGIFNDLVMRSSIPSLFIFWAFVAKVVIDANVSIRTRFKYLYALVLLVVLLGWYPASREIARSLGDYHLGAPDIASVSASSAANAADIVLQRIGDEDSLFYRYLSK